MSRRIVRLFGPNNVEVGLAEEYDDRARFHIPSDMVLVAVERSGGSRAPLNPPTEAHAGDIVEIVFDNISPDLLVRDHRVEG